MKLQRNSNLYCTIIFFIYFFEWQSNNIYKQGGIKSQIVQG